MNADYGAAGIENVTVDVNEGFYQGVVDSEGRTVECGHQRPAEIEAKWRAR
ncbi:hypothetical protein AB0M47_24445 [Hamadaea sp. NPDC051192]|uniref:hypothetical protein n=1 Tax=Hamadaea sp. NPDC051192 TaxID=3154940 RepID=UPI003430C81C